VYLYPMASTQINSPHSTNNQLPLNEFVQTKSVTQPFAEPKVLKLGENILNNKAPSHTEVLPTGLYGVDLENFESWLRPEDRVVLQTSSVPDTKLYYPEPFVASPSFVHEEI